MNTVIVDESARMSFGSCVSTQPPLAITPLATPPCGGTSIAPNGFVAWALSQVIVLTPRAVGSASASNAYARRLNVPLPRFGRKLVSSR